MTAPYMVIDTRNGISSSPNNAHTTLRFLYDTIGCTTVDVVGVVCEDGTVVDMWCDDEGLLTGQPLNPIASVLARRPIVGRVVIAKSTREGETIGLTSKDKNAVIATINNLINKEQTA